MRRRLLRAAAAITAAAITAFILVSTTFAATPTPEAGAGDPRSSGEGPGLVGDPLFAIAGVLGVVVIAIVVSLAYIRLTGGPRDTADRTPAGRR
jgi:hypothetical protein